MEAAAADEKSKPSSPRKVEVVFIRHAETEENVKVHDFVSMIHALGELRLPSMKQITQTLSLILMNEDSPLSARGHQQLAHMSDALTAAGFWNKFDFDLCAYSPYTRTKTTAMTLIPVSKHGQCVELASLREIAPLEHLYTAKLPARVEDLEQWITTTDVQKLVLVGHCKYFQELLQTNAFMWNCDVWKAALTIDQGVCEWSQPDLMVRSPYACPHPADGLWIWQWLKSKGRSRLAKVKPSPRPAAPQPFDDPEDEPFCRICQAVQSEMPDVPLIRPCLCSGSQALVHLDCLNQWRATSSEAFYKCSICKYSYRMKRSLWAVLLTSPAVVVLLALLILLLSSFAIGQLLQSAPKAILPVYVSQWVLNIVGWSDVRPLECDNRMLQRMVRVFELYGNAFYSKLYMMGLQVRCHDPSAGILRCLLLGFVSLGLVGQVGYYILYMTRLRHQDQGHFMGALGMTFVWFNAADITGTLRLWMVIGHFYWMSSVYTLMMDRFRHWAQVWFGDEIIEAM